MDDDLWIERWPQDGRNSRLASSTDQRVIGAAWRMAQVLGIGPKLLLHRGHSIIAEWEPVRFSGKH